MVALDEWALRSGQPLHFRLRGFPREAVDAERAILGITQAETGSALLTHWEFPETISEPVRWQYTPRSSASHATMASLLYAAKWIRSAVCAPTVAARPVAPEAIYLQPLHLTSNALSLMAGDVKRKLGALSSLLDASGGTGGRHRFPSQHPWG
jgi:hypothetical protein